MSGPDRDGQTAAHPLPRTQDPRREQELGVVCDLLEGSRSGIGGVVLVEGPVGIGKTTLLGRLADAAGPHGMRVLRAACRPADGDVPFSGVRQLFVPLLESLDEAERDVLLEGYTSAARSALAHPVPGEPAPPASYGVLHGLHRFTARLARREPLVLLVDDAQYADAATVQFLSFSARRLAGLPVLLAVFRRTGGMVRRTRLDELAAQPRCRVVCPRPLAVEGIAAMVARETGGAGDEELHTALLDATGGNPLLLRAALSGMRDGARPPVADSLLRGGAEEEELFGACVLRVVGEQTPAAAAAARALAVLGDGATSEMCADLTGVPAGRLVPALRTLCAIGLVRGSADDRTWSLSSPLLERAVLAAMDGYERSSAHHRAARLLAVNGSHARQVVDHLLKAGAAVTEAWASAALREAAREAVGRGDQPGAVTILRYCRAHEPQEDTELLVELGLAEASVDVSASVRTLELALPGVSDPARRLTVVTTLVEGLLVEGRADRAVRVLAEHRARAPHGDEASERTLEARRLLASYEVCGTAAPCDDLASDGGTAGERALLASQSVLSVLRGHRVAQAVDAARLVLRLGIPAEDSPFPLNAAAVALLYADRAEETERFCARIGGSDGSRPGRDFPALRAEAYYRLGELSKILAPVGTAAADGPAHRSAGVNLPLIAVRVHALLDAGDLAGADVVVGEDLRVPPRDNWRWNEYLCARGRLHLAHHRPETALVDLLECGRRQRKWGRTSPGVSSWWFWAGHAHLASGEVDAARSLAEEMVGAARKNDLPRALGMALSLQAATEPGPRRSALLAEAVAVLEGSTARLELARVLLAHGRALHEAGQVAVARDVLRRGLELAEAVGAKALREWSLAALTATGARPRRTVSSGVDSLTRSEAEVARLAAAGRSNQEIASALFVTQRTVELHLTSVYRKLGLTGRRMLRDVLHEGAESRSA
ncbi:ATP-binding protein [Streptantibioticus silvisoli]|uniref:AAA family ATPase n=1 Tax=Streptantibioticus silvisoli TaxID=2705255 RepID=A0ABT6VWX8_9ACTN|nr:LuxR family transcriptional regulator [Streptantibioticus silvisoli]MDI5962990.1 AAA family ATPase [Streptantibioticus silvisoli]